MTDTELKKLIEDCCDDIFNRLEPLANVKSRLYESLKPAINYTRCCDEFFCSGEESEYKKCNEQCGGCEDIEQARKTK